MKGRYFALFDGLLHCQAIVERAEQEKVQVISAGSLTNRGRESTSRL